MFQASIASLEGGDAEIWAESREFAGVIGMRDERVLIVGVQRRERTCEVADIGANAEVADPPGVDDVYSGILSRRDHLRLADAHLTSYGGR